MRQEYRKYNERINVNLCGGKGIVNQVFTDVYRDWIEHFPLLEIIHMLSIILLVLALPLVAVLSLALAVLTFYLVSPLISQLAILVGLSLIVLILVSGGSAWLIGERLLPGFRPLFTFIYSGVVVTLATFLIIKLFPRPVIPYQNPEPLAGMEYWSLPTGSRLAYVHVPEMGDTKPTPIVFLHGGPGFLILESDVEFYSQLAQDGYDVYLYDQVGSGRSSRLEDVLEYTTVRHVMDLEAIRTELGAD